MINYELNLRDYFRIIRKRRVVIFFAFIAVTFASWSYISRQPQTYQATTTLKVGERKTVAGLLTESIIYSPGNVMRSYKELIKGFPVMRKSAIKMGYIKEDDDKATIYRTIIGLQGRISTNILERTNIIEITVLGGNPDDVVLLANTVADVFIDENLLEKNRQAIKVRSYIEAQLANLEERIRTGEEKVRVYNEEVSDIRMSEPIEQKLVSLEFELVALLRKFTDKHPKVINLKEQISELENQLHSFSVTTLDYSSLIRQVDINKKLYGVLKERLEEARISEIEKVEDISIVNPAIKPMQPINPKKEMSVVLGGMLGLMLGCVIAFITESLDTSLGTIEDVESILKLPVLGVVPSVRSKSIRRMKFINRLKKRFSPDMIPDISEAYVRLIVHHEPKSSISESYRAIRTNLQLSNSRKTVLITSAGPREGKTTTLVNIGLAIAQTGAKTLLVSSDLRRPAVAHTFGISEAPGLYEVMTNVHSLDDCLRNVSDFMLGDMDMPAILKTPGIENVFILPSGHIPHNPAELLVTRRMEELHEELKQRFDVILYDSPPVLPITDAALLSSVTDAVVLVYEAGRTSRSALVRVKAQLESSGANIIGVVLNHTSKEVDLNVTFPYYKNKYYNYYSYYGEDKVAKSSPKSQV